MFERERHIAAVEIMHLAGAHVDGTDRQARLFGIDAAEIDNACQRLVQRIDRVEAGPLDADRGVETKCKRAVRRKIAGNAAENRHHLRGDIAAEQDQRLSNRHLHEGGRIPRRFALHPFPEFAQTVEPPAGLIAGNDGGVDRADRGPDHPVGFDPGFMQRLIDAALVSAKRAAALKHQYDLAGQSRGLFDRTGGACFNVRHIAEPKFAFTGTPPLVTGRAGKIEMTRYWGGFEVSAAEAPAGRRINPAASRTLARLSRFRHQSPQAWAQAQRSCAESGTNPKSADRGKACVRNSYWQASRFWLSASPLLTPIFRSVRRMPTR